LIISDKNSLHELLITLIKLYLTCSSQTPLYYHYNGNHAPLYYHYNGNHAVVISLGNLD